MGLSTILCWPATLPLFRVLQYNIDQSDNEIIRIYIYLNNDNVIRGLKIGVTFKSTSIKAMTLLYDL